jgi:hypothetical protein
MRHEGAGGQTLFTRFCGGVLIGLIAASAHAQNPAPAPTALPAAMVTVENPAALRGLNRVAIGSFTVDILDRLEATEQIGGIELISGAPSDLVVTLVGADRGRYEALADAAYENFVADMAKQGFTVISPNELRADAEFQKGLKTDAGASRDERSPAGSNRYVSAKGLPIYLVDETTVIPKMQIHILGPKPKRDPYIGWGSSLSAGYALLGFERQHAVARSLGAPILNVRITLLGGQARLDRAFWKTAGTAKTDAAMTFVALYNRVLVVGADKALARVSLSQDLATEKLGELVSTTTAGDKALQTAGNTAIAISRFAGAFVPGGSLIGAMHYGNKKTYEVRTDQATFEAALSGGFGAVSQAMAEELGRQRKADPAPASVINQGF